MITRRELRQQASRQGVSLGALEKDYVLKLGLQHVSPQQTMNRWTNAVLEACEANGFYATARGHANWYASE